MGCRSPARSARLIHRRPSAHPPRRGPFTPLSAIVRDREPDAEGQGWIADRRLRRAFPSVEPPPDLSLARHLDFGQNDARVLGCRIERDAFSLTLDDVNVGQLACAVRNAPIDGETTFPVTLRFEGVREFRVVHQRAIGDYRILRASLGALDSMLFDAIAIRFLGKDGDQSRFSLEFNRMRPFHPESDDPYANEITILLACERTSVVESLHQKWIETVGEESLPILQDLLGQGPLRGWGADDFDAFVEAHRNAPDRAS